MIQSSKTILTLAAMATLCAAPAFADRTLTGTVTAAEDGEPLIGATVALPAKDAKGATTVGVMTDLDGKFTLTVPDKTKEIECRYVGYTTKTVKLIPGTTTYNIALETSATDLAEVVVTGYQTIDRRKLTASVSKLTVDDAKLGAVMNIDQALQGQVAGLATTQSSGSPGAPLKIRIRGTSSLQGAQDPLWVIDGVPMNGTEMPSTEELKDIDNLAQTSIGGLNPADIESITVLKDAAATAIYGTRAANGVIVVTTKSGKQGKTQVGFSTRLSYSPRPDIDRLNLLNSSEKVDLELDLLRSGFTYREGKGAVSRLLSAAGQLAAYKTGGWEAVDPATRAQIDALRGISTDWNDILFRSTFNQEYNLNVSGGGDKATYYASFGYNNELGNVPGVDASRFNMSLKTRYNITKNFRVGASIFVNSRGRNSYLTDNDGFTNPVYYSRRANPYQLPFAPDGSYIYDKDIQGREDSDLKFNVFEERANTDYTQKLTGVTALADAELRFTPWLKGTTQIGYQYDNTSTQSFAGGETYAMRKEFYRTEIMGANGVR